MMRRRKNVGLTTGSFRILPLLLAAPTAGAALLTWSNSGGGVASNSANWSPTQIPTALDSLNFNLNAAYTVTFNASTTASNAQTYKRGTVTLNAASPHTVGPGGMAIG